MFLFGFILSLVTMVSLLVGVVSEKALCDPLRNPDPTKYNIIQLLDDYNLDFGVEVIFSEMLSNCHQNKTVYETFNLKSKFDIDEIEDTYTDIRAALEKLNLSGIEMPTNVVLVSNDTFDMLRKFSPNIDVDTFIDEVSEKVNTVSYLRYKGGKYNFCSRVQKAVYSIIAHFNFH